MIKNKKKNVEKISGYDTRKPKLSKFYIVDSPKTLEEKKNADEEYLKTLVPSDGISGNFFTLMNELAGGIFKMNKTTGEVTLDDGDYTVPTTSSVSGLLAIAIRDGIYAKNQNRAIRFKIIGDDESANATFIDSFQTGDVDSLDIYSQAKALSDWGEENYKKFTNGKNAVEISSKKIIQASSMGHFIRERFATENYEDNRKLELTKTHMGFFPQPRLEKKEEISDNFKVFRPKDDEDSEVYGSHEVSKIIEAKIVSQMSGIELSSYNRSDSRTNPYKFEDINYRYVEYKHYPNQLRPQIIIMFECHYKYHGTIKKNTRLVGNIIGAKIFYYK